MKNKQLPHELKILVSHSVTLLGQAIKQEYGDQFFSKIESTRKNLSKNWKGDHLSWQKDLQILNKEYSQLAQLNESDRLKFAHCNTCMLELINRCESAYRTYRLGGKPPVENVKSENWIIFVLTAHPTEARGPEFLALFERITPLLVESIQNKNEKNDQRLYHLLQVLLKVPLTRSQKPQVSDEAKNIYNYSLKPEMLSLMVKIRQDGTNVLLRTWAGGDKDGHPGVDEKTMLESLNLSRSELLTFVRSKLKSIEFEIDLMKDLNSIGKLKEDFKLLQRNLNLLKTLQKADGAKILKLRKDITSFKENYEKNTSLLAQPLQDILDLFWLFPALVLPLEIREDSSIVAESLKKPKDYAIGRMLSTLALIAEGNEPKWYVRGFVLSMCESSSDILNGIRLTQKILGKQLLPVVPLFETEKALVNGPKILEELFFKKKTLTKLHKKKWGGRFEVMLGYSDSSKESGVFPSRLLISQAMKNIDKKITSYKLTPVFFHGSGGSIERGGGSIQEQTQWWTKSAIKIFKATIQGEMVARTFASPQIFSGKVQKISTEWKRPRKKLPSAASTKSMNEFSSKVQKSYQQAVQDADFLKVVETASPYMFLSHLNIGSRPSKRTSKLQVGGLRAIPWILCWTQTRVLFPTWWGVGSAWEEMSASEKVQFKKAYKESDLLSSFIKILGFTLEKVELAVWRFYLEQSELPSELIESTFEQFLSEFNLSLKFFHEVSGQKNLLWYKPWLEESIHLRSPMIHPLNLLQMLAVKNRDPHLLRKTVTGISCGMMTTG